MTLNVAVVMPDEIIRSGLAAMLGNLDIVNSVTEYATTADLGGPSTMDKLDVLLVGGRAGEIDQSVTDSARSNGLKVLVVLDDSDPREVAWPAIVGAHGFLRRAGLTAERLGATLVRLADDQVFMPNELARELLANAGYLTEMSTDDSVRRPRSRPVKLTSRETEALSLLAHGLVNKQIARQLRISEHGVKRLVASVLTKLDCPNRTLAVATALREGLIRPNGTVTIR
jgi:two-component system nitrate/nitrite response regulator NarL